MKTALLLITSTTVLTTGILHGQGRILFGAIWPTVLSLGTLVGLALLITLQSLRRDIRTELETKNDQNS